MKVFRIFPSFSQDNILLELTYISMYFRLACEQRTQLREWLADQNANDVNDPDIAAAQMELITVRVLIFAHWFL